MDSRRGVVVANRGTKRRGRHRTLSRGAILAVFLVAIVLAANQAIASPPSPSPDPLSLQGQRRATPGRNAPQFKTGYEPQETTATPADAHTWLVFQNTSTHPQATPWAMSVYYETPGDVNDRYARIIDDPTGNTGNKVLHYWLKNAVVDSGYLTHTKGRIQTSFPALVDAFEVYGRQRMYIHEDMNLFHSYPPGGDPWWLGIILQTLWSNKAWLGEPNPSRITLSMFSLGGQMHLDLLCRSAVDSRVFWDEPNTSYVLPIGEWITVEMGYKMGNASTGRVVVVITRESTGEREVVFNVTDWTYDPLADDPGGTGPISLSDWNPQKLYASDNVIHHIRDQGGVAQVYWDDYEFSGAWPPAWP